MEQPKSPRHGGYRIGQLARELHVTPQALRYYEQEGLIPKPERNAAAYRIYSEETRARLLFLRRAQQFGFKLEEIKILMGAQANRRGGCAKVKSMLDSKLADLEERFGLMQQLRADLLNLRHQCEAALAVDASCPVMVTLAKRNAQIEKRRAGNRRP